MSIYIDRFKDWLKDEAYDSKSIQAYVKEAHRFMAWLHGRSGEQNLPEVKPTDLKEYFGMLNHTLGFEVATIRKSMASLKTYFRYLHKELNHLPANPMEKFKLPRVESSSYRGESRVMKWLSMPEQNRFLDAAEDEADEFFKARNLAIIDLMLFAGLRVDEVISLHSKDLTVEEDVQLTIREAKGGKYATVLLLKHRAKNLKKYLKIRKLLEPDSPALFVSKRTHSRLTAKAVNDLVNKYADKAGLVGVTPHRFRHAFCKNLANNGVPLETIRRLARHERIETTLIYVDSSTEEMEKALKTL